MWYREGYNFGCGITNDCVLSGGVAVTVLRDNLCCNERLGGKASAWKPSGGNRTRKATFGKQNWRRTSLGRKPNWRANFGALYKNGLATVGKKQDHFGVKVEIRHWSRRSRTFGYCGIETTLGVDHFGGKRTEPRQPRRRHPGNRNVNDLETTLRRGRR
jgi:hypothetical protein